MISRRVVDLEHAAADESIREAVLAGALGANRSDLLDHRRRSYVHARRESLGPSRLHPHGLVGLEDATAGILPHLVERHASAAMREVEVLVRRRLPVEIELALIETEGRSHPVRQ